jgi:hypothetical protein
MTLAANFGSCPPSGGVSVTVALTPGCALWRFGPAQPTPPSLTSRTVAEVQRPVAYVADMAIPGLSAFAACSVQNESIWPNCESGLRPHDRSCRIEYVAFRISMRCGAISDVEVVEEVQQPDRDSSPSGIFQDGAD